MYYFKLIGQFYQDMKRQKMRTFMTVFGVCWGTIAVVLLLAFGVGVKANSFKAMHGLGTNILIFGGNRTTKAYQGMGTGRWIPNREEDIALLKEKIPEMELITPEAGMDVKMNYKRETRNVRCSGIYPSFGELRNLIPEQGGRFINRLDMDKQRRVVFIGNELRDELFGKGSNPVGKVAYLNGTPFTVVGVMQDKAQTSSYGGRDKNNAYMPYSSYSATFGRRNIQRFICRAADPVDTPRMKKGIYEVLARKHKFDPADEEAVFMWDTTKGEQMLSYFFLGFQIFLALGGILTMIVGGIGVANIMYIVVRERRREVGIKMALGATPRTILLQFMVETFLIVAIGGVLGFAFSYSVVGIFHTPLLKQATIYVGYPQISSLVSMVTLAIIGTIGFAAGFAPARRAANMDPIQALEF
ncbi:MAG TPA: ABC transporter permease [archaeon]|nr:ABC transporter permease [archaeon]